jgi:tetratricopeptide (TPR) repeat protein
MLVAPPPSRAADPPAPGEPQDLELARAHFKTGEIYYERGRFPDAAREFEEAYRLSSKSDLLYNMGKSYDGAGDHARALDAYRRFLAALPSSTDRPAIERRVAALERLVGRVTIASNVEGAAITIDGDAVGASPLPRPLELNPGGHAIVASKEGYRSYRGTVVVAPGSEPRVDAKLESLVQVKIVEVPRQEKKVPVYKRWWLWTVVGAVVVGGVVTAGVLGSREAPIDGPAVQLPAVREP